jgi:hypothetical protein
MLVWIKQGDGEKLVGQSSLRFTGNQKTKYTITDEPVSQLNLRTGVVKQAEVLYHDY